MTNKRSNVHHTKVLPLSLSDYDCVMCVRKINHRKIPFKTITYRDYSTYNHTVPARDCCENLTTRCGKLVFNMQDCEYLTNRCGKLVLTSKPVNT